LIGYDFKWLRIFVLGTLAHRFACGFGTARAQQGQLLVVTVDMAGFRYPFQVDRKEIDG